MENQISCPFCKTEIPASSENCPQCENEMPWMSHIYKRETSFFRGLKNFSWDLVESISSGRTPNKNKLFGAINAVLAGRAVLVIGSILGTILVVVEVWTLIQQKQIMETQSDYLKIQNDIFERQQATVEFEQYTRIRDLLADVSYYKAPAYKDKTPTSSEYAIEFISTLASKQPQIYKPILKHLLFDSNESVSSGAFLSLLKLGDSLSRETELAFYNIDFGKEISIKNISSRSIYFSGCEFEKISLHNCEFSRIAINGMYDTEIEIYNSAIKYFEYRDNNYGNFDFKNSLIANFYFNATIEGEVKAIRLYEVPIITSFKSTYIHSTLMYGKFLDFSLSTLEGEDNSVKYFYNLNFSDNRIRLIDADTIFREISNQFPNFWDISTGSNVEEIRKKWVFETNQRRQQQGLNRININSTFWETKTR